MDKSQFSALRAVSGIAIMAIIGMLGCFVSELKVLFLHGTPFPLIFIVVVGMFMEIMGLLAGFMPHNEMIHEPNARTLKSAMTYMLGSIAICVFLVLFFIAYDNFMAQAPGGGNSSEWAPVIFMAYAGIVAQMYLMYRVLKKEKND